MVREEIITGLKNAVERGESMEKAMQSMLNAGYSIQEIQEASGKIDMGVIGMIKTEGAVSITPSTEKNPTKNRKVIIGLLIVLLVLVLVAGAFIFFGDKILSMISTSTNSSA